MLVIKMDNFYGEVFSCVVADVTVEMVEQQWGQSAVKKWEEWLDLNDIDIDGIVHKMPQYLVFRDGAEIDTIYSFLSMTESCWLQCVELDPQVETITICSLYFWLIHKMKELKAGI